MWELNFFPLSFYFIPLVAAKVSHGGKNICHHWDIYLHFLEQFDAYCSVLLQHPFELDSDTMCNI